MLKVNATESKARCLALLDQVARTGEELVITKRGRPVAQVVPMHRKRTQHPFDDYLATRAAAVRGSAESRHASMFEAPRPNGAREETH